MKLVNSELYITTEDGETVLLRKGHPLFDQRVDQLFGTTHPNVRRAVEEFLALDPSSFDHHRLRIVAASAGVFADENHVAHMIRQLRPTHMELAAKPIDLAVARQQFETSLPETYRPETKRALVLDLVQSTTLQVLENSPFENVPEAGRSIVRDDLRRRLKGGVDERRELLFNRHTDTDVCTALLDWFEAKVERAERDTQNGVTTIDHEDGLPEIFGLASKMEDSPISDQQLLRAWTLYRRCRPNSVVLSDATTNARLLSLAGHSVFDAVIAYRDARLEPDCEQYADGFLKDIVTSKALSEETAQEIFQTTGHYSFGFTGVIGDQRLGLLRQMHYARSSELLEPPSAEDLDRAVIAQDPDRLYARLVQSIETEAALNLLIDRFDEMGFEVRSGLVANKNLSSIQIDKIIDALDTTSFTLPSGKWRPPVAQELLSEQQELSDAQLARVTEKAIALSPDNDVLVRVAALAASKSSNGRLLQARLDQCHDKLSDSESRMLRSDIAGTGRSTYLLSELARRAINTNDQELAARLMGNGYLHRDLWSALGQCFPRPSIDRLMHRMDIWIHGYNAEDYEKKMNFLLSGEAGPYHPEAMVRTTASLRWKSHDVQRILDSDLITDERVVALTTDTDMHIALSAATHRRAARLDDADGFVLPAEKQLRDTAYAVEHRVGEFPPDRRLNSWDKLPNRDDERFDRTPLHELLEGQVVDGLTITFPETPRKLKDLSREMRNCLSGYTDAVASGETLIVSARTDDDVFAAALERGRSDHSVEVTLGEVNSKFNEYNVPDSFIHALEQMVEQINAGTLRPVEREPVASDQSVASSESAIEEPRPVLGRPPRRQRIPPLQADANGTAADDKSRSTETPDAPSLLASGAAGQESDVPDTTIDPVDHLNTSPDRGLDTL